MPECPQCHKVIDRLIKFEPAEVKSEIWCEDGEIYERGIDDYKLEEEPDFECPECQECLFHLQEDAEAFLKQP